MTRRKRHAQLIPSALDDRALVVMAQKDVQRAWQELVIRYANKVQNQVARLAKRSPVRGLLLQDLQQNAILWLAEAIRRYDTHQVSQEGGRSFASFVRQVIEDRFRDLSKSLRRREKHLDRSLGAAQALDRATNEQRRHGRPSPPSGEDPTIAAEQHELDQRLQECAAQLDERDRLLLEAMKSNNLAEFAQQQGVTLSAVRRWRAKLRKKLRLALRAWLGE